MTPRASFRYNGKQILLDPSSMVLETEYTYVYALPDGLQAVYEVKPFPSGNGGGKEGFLALLRFRNQGDAPTGRITMAKTLDIAMEKDRTAPVLFHGLLGDSCGAQSFLPLDFPLSEEYHMEPFGGRSSNTSAFPFFDLTTEEHSWLFAVGWTGQWCADLWADASQLQVQIGLCDCDFYLEPGESVRLPSVLLLNGDEPAALRRSFRQAAREQLSPKRRLGEVNLPFAIQCFDRYFQGQGGSKREEDWATQNGQLRVLTEAQKCHHLDTLWMDAAWFRQGFPDGVGNYAYGDGFPEGLSPVADAVHKEGMKFVLWFEPERVCRDTEVWTKHPEMLLRLPEAPDTCLLNLADQKARAWLLEKLSSMIAENHVDIYRQDFNMEPLPYWRQADPEGRRGITEMKYIEGLYWLWDSLAERFPRLLIDDCASGGRRIDLETMSRAVYLWRSDTGCYPDSAEMRPSVWSVNQILTLSEYLPYHACAVWKPDAYTVHSAATQGLACNFDILSPGFDFELAEQSLREAKEQGSYWEKGDFYPLTPPSVKEDVWAAYQLAEQARGTAYFFRREHCPLEEQSFSLRGIDPQGRYQVCLIDESFQQTSITLEGSRLLAGIRIRIPSPRASLVLRYELLKREEASI